MDDSSGPFGWLRLRINSAGISDFRTPNGSFDDLQPLGDRFVVMKRDMQDWVQEALRGLGGSGTIVQVARQIWTERETELRSSGDLFFTWQYDMRWAANVLRRRKIIRPVLVSPVGVWELE